MKENSLSSMRRLQKLENAIKESDVCMDILGYCISNNNMNRIILLFPFFCPNYYSPQVQQRGEKNPSPESIITF